MATIHFRDGEEPQEYERVFVTESGWVAVTEAGSEPVLYPADRVAKIEGTEDIFYDTVALTTELGSKRVDDEGHVLQEPELLRKLVVELEID